MKYIRIIIFIPSLLLLSFCLHYFIYIRRYNTGYSYDSISNSLFIVGVVFFLPALMAQIGSYKFFYGIQYALRGLFSDDFRRRYKNLSDYLLEKGPGIKTSIFTEFLISSGAILIAAIVFGMLWGRHL